MRVMPLGEVREKIVKAIGLSNSDLDVLGRAYGQNLEVQIEGSKFIIDIPGEMDSKSDFRRAVSNTLGVENLDEVNQRDIDYEGRIGSVYVVNRGIPF